MHPLTGRALHRNVPRGFASARLRRWYPLHFRQMARPGYLDARKASLRAMAPAVDGFHGLAVLRGGSEEAQERVRGTVSLTNGMGAAVGDGVMALALTCPLGSLVHNESLRV